MNFIVFKDKKIIKWGDFMIRTAPKYVKKSNFKAVLTKNTDLSALPQHLKDAGIMPKLRG